MSSDARQTTDRRQTEIHFRKKLFFAEVISKRKDMMKIPKVIFHMKPIPSH